jgi:hypothetical protein
MTANSAKDFSMQVKVEEREIRATLSGTADLRALEYLDEQLSSLHSEAVERKIPLIRFDLRGLEFMNSSCFRCFITLLAKDQELPEPDRYRVVVVSNKEMHWQRRSLEGLRGFAIDLVSIEA